MHSSSNKTGLTASKNIRYSFSSDYVLRTLRFACCYRSCCVVVSDVLILLQTHRQTDDFLAATNDSRSVSSKKTPFIAVRNSSHRCSKSLVMPPDRDTFQTETGILCRGRVGDGGEKLSTLLSFVAVNRDQHSCLYRYGRGDWWRPVERHPQAEASFGTPGWFLAATVGRRRRVLSQSRRRPPRPQVRKPAPRLKGLP